MRETKYQTGMIDPLNKALGRLDAPLTPAEAGQPGWQLLREELSLPAAVLYEDRLVHNLQWMRKFMGAYGVQLAPHGKTTMAPKLFARQLAEGAWGITLATAQQTAAAAAHGVRRVLMANQLVGRRNMEIVADLLRDPGFEFFSLVDSAALVDQLGAFFQARGQKLQVLLELGVEGGRTGVRDAAQQAEVLAALSRWPDALSLAGVEIYEGVLSQEADIRRFLQRTVAVTRELAGAARFGRSPVVMSGAGSAWYDVVAEEFARTDIGAPIDIVLRPGCYLTHDVGVYRAAQERILASNPVAQKMREGLLPALQLWAYVQSIPEPRRAIIGMGKRDAAFDAGMPIPAQIYRPGAAAPVAVPAGWTVTGMMDQHAYLQIDAGDDIRVGDMIAFDISHPCLTFDKWRHIPVLDGQLRVIDIVQTFF
ncbi:MULTISPECIES: amino acid deaminase [unclassified Cupriavidus]|uniref:amino acid deaminase n=1 Tax=unclassified Cupriavidus TaxID=2640874 RepID=UPI001C002E3B|nr:MULTISPECIES: amino acid deaminase [unclassified Cupriavidus]MCA3184738.1 amino acid deaminase [Cupriavidus sp.]MCA3192076.1 amino acid deaminase [Cupriavidus sp.]MCA3197821.1 amino acid deaminase [Cupriavidus sp.]MCA3202873.1 amino acid deaminase [Cupriavidus sp.]MCA3206423.1 amino acid deaminase [Cupriavidus sp.]